MFCCLLQDEYPQVFRFTASVFPSEEDDVITSPYNSILAASKLVEHAGESLKSCILLLSVQVAQCFWRACMLVSHVLQKQLR